MTKKIDSHQTVAPQQGPPQQAHHLQDPPFSTATAPHAATDTPEWGKSLTYWDYLRLDRLLDLQSGTDANEEALLPDELHFIIVHQTFELWFKLVLRELRVARDQLGASEVPENEIPFVVHHLRRVCTILEQVVGQFRVMETLTPQDFLAFRDKLVPASGFQSYQMREIESVLGLDPTERSRRGMGDPLAAIRSLAGASSTAAAAWSHVKRALDEKNFLTALEDWLHRTPIDGSQPNDPNDEVAVGAFIERYLGAMRAQGTDGLTPHRALGAAEGRAAEARLQSDMEQARAFLAASDTLEPARARKRRIRAACLFIESYRELPLLAWPRALLDTVVELDAQLVLFRSRHARMAERVIGRRMGTGGSDGVDYLDRTTGLRIFRDLWAVRTILLPKAALPPLEHPEIYDFA